MSSVDYREWVPISAIAKGLAAMVFAILAFVTFWVFLLGGLSAENVLGVVFGWGVVALIALLLWNYRGISIKISSQELTVAYGRFDRKTFQLKDIASCKKTKANFRRYFGFGIRLGTDGSLAYSTSLGDAVEVTPRNGKVFVFSTKKPDEVCKIIKSAI